MNVSAKFMGGKSAEGFLCPVHDVVDDLKEKLNIVNIIPKTPSAHV